MSLITRRWFILAATVLVIASAAVLALLLPDEVMPGAGNPFSVFVQPGVTIWWLVLAEPSSYAPDSPTGFAFAAAENGAFWLLVLWLAAAIVHSSVTRWWFVLAAPVLAIASAAALALLASTEVIPSAVKNPLYGFVSPGAFVWWLAQGSLFGAAAPSSPTGIAFAAAINGAFWLLVLWFVVVVVRAVRRMFSAPPS